MYVCMHACMHVCVYVSVCVCVCVRVCVRVCLCVRVMCTYVYTCVYIYCNHAFSFISILEPKYSILEIWFHVSFRLREVQISRSTQACAHTCMCMYVARKHKMGLWLRSNLAAQAGVGAHSIFGLRAFVCLPFSALFLNHAHTHFTAILSGEKHWNVLFCMNRCLLVALRCFCARMLFASHVPFKQ